ncbi:MAG: hypothetical protein WBG19_06125 [Thermoplasmata archaeon]
MNAQVGVPPVLGFDPFGAAAGVALITGALAVILPFLSVLTGTLAALAVAGWALGRGRAYPRPSWFRHRIGGAVACGVGAATLLYLAPPASLGPFRALLLALALALFWVEESLGRPYVRRRVV